MKGFVKYCKDYILDHIDNYEGQTHYACDFCFEITNETNANCSLTFNKEEALRYLQEWFDDAVRYWDYEKENFGHNTYSPYDDPEAYMVCMVIEGCSAILSQVPCIDKNWNDEIVINTAVITEIKDFVNGFDENIELF